ncbi:hypothetical protein [Bosea sp. (in: a-proteobacteria)]|jgi:hypothetical protein|uniref:hypothetical protein n=1 Tax=Bosea sp. (in: a-proteobacteria) TaxID=1871050 RepID=UPI002DDCF0DF|nr:hypothetical protein [Bosea sp. (in: a-proteobacteria)]HEV2510344.1 hypothetical protein [Bosea sp. (in: a-proteobacteria)]
MSDDDLDHPKWVAIAAEALQRVNYAPHGKKNAALQSVVNEYGPTANHIRRMMRALTFTLELSPTHPELAQALRGVTFKTAELVDRWYRRDPVAAIDAAERYVSRRLSFRALLAEYAGEALRPVSGADDPGLDLDSFRAVALRHARHLIGVEVDEGERPKELKHLTGIDHLLQERTGLKRWAVIIVLPDQAPALYRARRELDLGRALALRQVKIEPIIVMPQAAHPDVFKELLTSFHAEFVHVAVVKIRPTYV